MMNELVQNVYGDFLDPKKLLNRFSQMDSKKQPWRTKWQKIQDMTYPSLREYTSKSYAGTPNTEKIANHCSAITGKINKSISILHSQITDPMSKWMGLSFRKIPTRLMDGQGVNLSENPIVEAWLQQCEDALYDLFNDPRSNFYPSSYIFHRDWFILGSSCRHVCIRKDTGDIYFNCVGMEDIFVDTGSYDQIEIVARKYSLTAEQAFKLWGENIGEDAMQTLSHPEGRISQRKFEFIEMCFETPPEARRERKKDCVNSKNC